MARALPMVFSYHPWDLMKILAMKASAARTVISCALFRVKVCLNVLFTPPSCAATYVVYKHLIGTGDNFGASAMSV